MELLRAEHLVKTYGKDENVVAALDDVSLSIEKGEFVAIIGASGSGKSTLLHMLGGVDRPTSGTVLVDGKDIFKQNDEQLSIFRRREIGLVYQFFNLIPVLTVVENITMPVLLDHRKVNRKRLNELLEILLADEPTGNLDSKNSQEVVELLKYSNEKYNQTTVLITHDENVALQAKRIITIRDGKIRHDEVIRK